MGRKSNAHKSHCKNLEIGREKVFSLILCITWTELKTQQLKTRQLNKTEEAIVIDSSSESEAALHGHDDGMYPDGEFIDEYGSEEAESDEEDLDAVMDENDSQKLCSLLFKGMAAYLEQIKQQAHPTRYKKDVHEIWNLNEHKENMQQRKGLIQLLCGNKAMAACWTWIFSKFSKVKDRQQFQKNTILESRVALKTETWTMAIYQNSSRCRLGWDEQSLTQTIAPLVHVQFIH